MIQDERDGVIKTQRLRGHGRGPGGRGELEAARVAIEAIQGDGDDKAHALVALAKAQAKAGDKTGARASLVAAFEAPRRSRRVRT